MFVPAHGIKVSNGVCLKPAHGAAAVKDEYNLRQILSHVQYLRIGKYDCLVSTLQSYYKKNHIRFGRMASDNYSASLISRISSLLTGTVNSGCFLLFRAMVVPP